MADSSIQVVVRVRPMNAKELSLLAPVETPRAFQGDGGLAASPSKTSIAAMRTNYIKNIIAPVDERVLVFDPIEPDAVQATAGGSDGGARARVPAMPFHSHGRRPRDVRYAFDRVFPPATMQREVYQHTVEPMLSGVLSGFNASVFAYGVRLSAHAGDRVWQDPHDQRHVGRPRPDLSHDARAVPAHRVRQG